MASSPHTTPNAGPSPEHVFDSLIAFQQAAALKAALDLDLFTIIGQGRRSVSAISSKAEASERGVRILCDYLVVREFLTKQGNEYGLTSEAAVFLDRNSPAYMGGVRHFLQSREILAGSQTLTEAVRTGRSQLPGLGSVEPDNPAWVEFAHSMTAMMGPACQGIVELLGPARIAKVLDIAAGHGLFGITLAKHHPEAHITAVDWAAVLDVAQENAKAAGVHDRYSRRPWPCADHPKLPSSAI
jgi:hypothetical protein